MKLYANDDPEHSRPASGQSVSQSVSFKNVIYSMRTVLFKMPATSVITLKDKHSSSTLISDSVIKSNAGTVKAGDSNKQTPLSHSNTHTYNQVIN